MAETKTITPAEFGEMVGTDGRTVRKFLRATRPDEAPGKGSRWSLKGTKTELNKLQKDYTNWATAQEKARAEKAEKVETAEVEIEEDESE